MKIIVYAVSGKNSELGSKPMIMCPLGDFFIKMFV